MIEGPTDHDPSQSDLKVTVLRLVSSLSMAQPQA